jgi:hypothetical protein
MDTLFIGYVLGAGLRWALGSALSLTALWAAAGFCDATENS